MKYIVILADGMADRPLEELGGLTVLEKADKPTIDALAALGEVGLVKTVPDSLKPGSDVANLSVMGYAPEKYYTGRSPLEAISMGVPLKDDDIAIRCNLVTLSDEEPYEKKRMADYSAGEITTEEAKELISAVAEKLNDDLHSFHNGISYRHCLVRHSSRIGTDFTPPHDISDKPIAEYLPKGLYGEEMLLLMKKSYDILAKHPVNVKRRERGLNPATSIWLWGEGTKPSLPSFYDKYHLKGEVISAVDLIKGLGISAEMRVPDIEGATGNLHTNFNGKAKAAIDAFKDGYDYVYLHMEAPDECGHQGDTAGKIRSIEIIDSVVVRYIKSELDRLSIPYRMLIMPDHPTPISIKTHSREAVPYLIYDSTKDISNGAVTYSEREAANTKKYYADAPSLIEHFLEK